MIKQLWINERFAIVAGEYFYGFDEESTNIGPMFGYKRDEQVGDDFPIGKKVRYIKKEDDDYVVEFQDGSSLMIFNPLLVYMRKEENYL